MNNLKEKRNKLVEPFASDVVTKDRILIFVYMNKVERWSGGRMLTPKA